MHRVLFLSHTYIDPATRGKLRALAARGLEVTVAVPQRWREHALGRAIETAWERQNGVEVFPVPTSRSGDPMLARFGRRAGAARGAGPPRRRRPPPRRPGADRAGAPAA